jgi:hypothetical protein
MMQHLIVHLFLKTDIRDKERLIQSTLHLKFKGYQDMTRWGRVICRNQALDISILELGHRVLVMWRFISHSTG